MEGKEEESRMTPRCLAWEMRQFISLFTERGVLGDRAGLRRGPDQCNFGYIQLVVPMTHLGRHPVGSWRCVKETWLGMMILESLHTEFMKLPRRRI